MISAGYQRAGLTVTGYALGKGMNGVLVAFAFG